MQTIPMAMYSLAVFDLDGTLIETAKGLIKTLNETLAHYGYPTLSENDAKKLIGPKLFDTFYNRYGKNVDKANEMTEYFRNVYAEKYIFDGFIYPGIEELLSKLKTQGIKTAIATNKRSDYMEQIVEHFGLNKYFDRTYGTDWENKLGKSDILAKCIADFDVIKKDAVMVGDTIADKEAAVTCGIDFIPVSYGFGKWEKEKTYSVEELEKTIIG